MFFKIFFLLEKRKFYFFSGKRKRVKGNPNMFYKQKRRSVYIYICIIVYTNVSVKSRKIRNKRCFDYMFGDLYFFSFFYFGGLVFI